MNKDQNQNSYIFLCVHTRETKRACANAIENDSLFQHFKQLLTSKRAEYPGRVIKVNQTGCLSRCKQGPIMVIFPENIWYCYQTIEDIDEIVNEHLIKGIVVDRLLIKKVTLS